MPSAAGFLYGESESSLIDTVYCGGSVSGASGQFSAALKPLNPNTTYYCKAFLQYSGGTVVTSPSASSFTTSNHTWSLAERGYFELPAITDRENYVGTLYGSGGTAPGNRNYTYNYSYKYFGSLWVAYPLTASHLSGSASSSWQGNSSIPDEYEITGMLSGSYPSNYSEGSAYSKGHQIPNADRKSDATMNQQTYYMTNQTPQIGDQFNGSVWQNLENAVRDLTGDIDTVYVVTGACYRTVGGTETIKYLSASNSTVTPSSLPIPNYYWKVLLKVKRNGTTITSASAIGFWFEHKAYASGTSYTGYAKSVSEIEDLTGFDFFVNLPSSLKSAAKSNSSWTTFQNFN